MEWTEFLETVPPGVEKDVENLIKKSRFGDGLEISDADIRLYCDSEKCQGTRFFHAISTGKVEGRDKRYDFFITYWCRNCQYKTKTFALRIVANKDESMNGKVIKYGEMPNFGPTIPSRLVNLIGPDREIFLKGRRAEIQGLGIGAFSYYRRVVENQKGRLLSKIKDVAQRLNASPQILSQFDKAIQETQFSKAIDSVKDVIPETLLIDSHNPLMLLHKALSEGLHAKTDEDCLNLATSIRVILTELSERITVVLKDEEQIKQALSSILNRDKNNVSKTDDTEE